MKRLVILALGLLALGAGCKARTQIMVTSDTNLDVPGQIDGISIQVTGPDGTMVTADANMNDLPAVFGAYHEGGDLGPVSVRVEGTLGGTFVIAREATLSFQPGRTVVLPMNLYAACVGMTCAGGQTCGDGSCRNIEVGDAELRDWTGTAPGIGAPVGDAGTDGPVCTPLMEACNGRDDDCDGRVDESFDRIVEACNARDDDCDGTIDEDTDAIAEECNGMDEDCDSMVDEGFDGIAETCDGLDQDCDGTIDEGFDGIVELCNGLDEDCDGMTDEGFDLMTDLMNCGTCGNECMLANATPVCTAGVCEIDSCDGAFLDCDTDPTTGCEIDSDTDDANCGMCGMMCGLGASCGTGACACTPPLVMGTSSCVDLSRDPENCGMLAMACAATQACSGSTCVCRPGLVDDGMGGCVDTNIDPLNCGSVGNDCGGNVCRDGTCRASCGPLTQCGDACTDLSGDVFNCGACGNACSVTQTCSGGMCRDYVVGIECTSCPCTSCAATDTCCEYPAAGDVICVDGPCP
jgi:hypothetical protein